MTAPPTPGHGGSPSIVVDDYWWYAARAPMLDAFLGRHASGARTALDIGSADAPSAAWFRERIERTVSLDIDPRGLHGDAVCGSALALPFAGSSFDVIAAFDVIEHLEPEGAALAEIRRVIRPGGWLLASVPAYQWAWSDHDTANGHHRRYTRPRLVRSLVSAGFRVDRASYAFAAVFPLFAVERLARRARHGVDGQAHDIATVPMLPRPVDRALRTLCRLDEGALRRGTLPFGSSVFVAAQRL